MLASSLATTLLSVSPVLFAQDVLDVGPLTFTVMGFGFAIGAIFGGYVADKLIGFQRSILTGAVIMAIGQFGDRGQHRGRVGVIQAGQPVAEQPAAAPSRPADAAPAPGQRLHTHLAYCLIRARASSRCTRSCYR